MQTLLPRMDLPQFRLLLDEACQCADALFVLQLDDFDPTRLQVFVTGSVRIVAIVPNDDTLDPIQQACTGAPI